jgi:hypothetical protein
MSQPRPGDGGCPKSRGVVGAEGRRRLESYLHWTWNNQGYNGDKAVFTNDYLGTKLPLRTINGPMVVQRLIKERQSPSIALCLWGFSLVGRVNTNSTQVLHSPRLIHPSNPRLERRLIIEFPANVPTWMYRPALAEASFDSLFIDTPVPL